MNSNTTGSRPRVPATGSAAVTAQVLAITLFTFLAYFTIGLPMAVLPGYVHNVLGFGSVLAGIAVSVQYVATLLSRSQAGRMADTVGPKETVLFGLAACAASGVLLLAAYAFERTAWLSLSCLFISRLVLGFGESWVGTGAIIWGIGRVGPEHMARVISWNGISTYGALAVGAPLGVYLVSIWSFGAVGALVLLVGLAGMALALPRAKVAVQGGARMPFGNVVMRVLPHGLALGLGSVGFGSIATFITLYYSVHQWANAAFTLSVFGFCFIAVRLILGNAITRFGGFRVAGVSFAVECIGLILLWGAMAPWMAVLGAALTGCGFSLVFPSLGVEAVNRIPHGSRGAALAAYSAFCYDGIYLFAGLGAFVAIAIVLVLIRQARSVPASSQV
jgi:predicted MFS family arabinose efflux permease